MPRYVDPYNEGKQKVLLVSSMIGEQDGMENFVLVGDDMESHVFDEERAQREGEVSDAQQLIVNVPSMTVHTFARKYHVPKTFAILSIDAEGIGDKVHVSFFLFCLFFEIANQAQSSLWSI